MFIFSRSAAYSRSKMGRPLCMKDMKHLGTGEHTNQINAPANTRFVANLYNTNRTILQNTNVKRTSYFPTSLTKHPSHPITIPSSCFSTPNRVPFPFPTLPPKFQYPPFSRPLFSFRSPTLPRIVFNNPLLKKNRQPLVVGNRGDRTNTVFQEAKQYKYIQNYSYSGRKKTEF